MNLALFSFLNFLTRRHWLLSSLLLLPLLSWGQTTILNETFGASANSTTGNSVTFTIAAYAAGTAPNTFATKPSGYSYGSGGATNPSDIRSTSASASYAGATGGGNTFFSSSSGEYGFAIGNINASSYTGLALSFGLRKEAATAYTLVVDYSTDGTTYTPLTVAGLPGSTAALGWYGITGVGLPAAAQSASLTIRFRKTGSTGLRVDDVVLTGTAAANAPALTTTATTAFTAFSTPVGTPSTAQTYALAGSNLAADVLVTAPSGYEVAQSAGTTTTSPGTYAASLTVLQADATAGRTIYVRLTGATAGTYAGSVTNTSTTASASVAVTGNTVGLTVNPSSLTVASTPQGTASAFQTYTLTGAGLSSSVTVTAPSGYEVAQSAGTSTTSPGTYAASLTVTQAAATAGRTIYVRLTGALAGTYADNVTNAATGAATQNVAVSGTVTPPTLTVTPNSLSGFTTPQGTASAFQTYALAGTGLSSSVTVTAPGGYEVAQSAGTSTTSPGTYAASLTVTQAAATAGRTIYVRLTGATAGTYTDNVTNAATGAATQNVAVSGTVGAPAPSLTVSATTLPAFNTLAGAPSAARSYTLSGVSLPADAVVTAPAGYEVSQTSATAGFASTQTVAPAGGSLSATIYVRLTGAAAGTPSGEVTNTSPGATPQTVAVTGTVVGKPTGTPTITAGVPTFNSVTLNLGAADGTNLLVVVRPAGTTATAPTDQLTYTGRTAYGAGTALGTGFAVFAAANAASVTVTGLSESTAYAADVYTYNAGSASGFESYGPTSGTVAFTTPVQPPSPAGVLLFEDNFDYAATTPLNTQGWTVLANAGTNVIRAASGNVTSSTYPQGAVQSTGGTSALASLTTSGEDLGKGGTRPTGTTTLYGAAVINVSAAQSGGDYFTALAPNSSGYRSRVFIRSTGAGFAFGLTVGSENETYESTPTVFSFGTPYVLVMKAENSAATNNRDVASLYVLPAGTTSTQEPTTPLLTVTATSTANNTSALNSFALRQGSASAAPTLTIDGVRLATGWGAAIGRPVFTDANGVLAAGNYYSLRATGIGTKATLSGPAFLEKQLNLDGGQVVTTSASLLTLRARNIIGDGFDILVNPGGTSYVDGPVARESVTGASLLFPIGRSGNYRPLTLNISSFAPGTTTYTAVQTEGPPADQTINAPLTRISRVRYFSITPSPVPAAGVFTGTVALSFGNDDAVTDPSVASFVVAKSDGAGWSSIGRGVNTATSLTSDTFQDFSDFSLASTAADVTLNPLPVQLTSFTAARTASGVQVAWATASELGSDRFEVERSLNGTTFGRVASVPAQGNTTRAHSYTALDRSAPAALLYYRLRQVDRDGTVAYSPIVTVAAGAGATAEFALAPNPAHASISFLTEAATAYTVRNPLGQAVRTGTTHPGTNTIAVEELPAGVYLFELHGGQGRVVRRFVKE